ncbi:MAG TPA: radical SAM family heme chaperone HemW [Candidatus Limnocylindria bacterium]|nr:radical SAM family heme chaperone HemW [Candidatus Limnocylindria bacterium]
MSRAGAAAGAHAPVALYVHVPFCLSICPYCDFVVYAGKATRGPSNRVGDFLAALIAEFRLRGELARLRFGAPPGLASVYIGGGTPSLLSAAQMGLLLGQVERSFGLAPGAEITLEVNPGPGERGELAGFRAAGVNRLSIGAQSMVAAELRRLGRRHSPADVAAAVREARAAGFTNLSVDLLYDVPGQTLESWRQSLAAVLELAPEHVSAYALDLAGPAGTADHLTLRPGAARWRERARSEQDEDRSAACYEIVDELLGAAGLEWYELSNWARPGYESRHNLGYWRWLPYEAVGPGAHAFDGARTRRWNAARLDRYVAALTAEQVPELPPGGSETLDEATRRAERAILALRTRTGLPAAQARLPAFAGALAWARSAGLLESAGSLESSASPGEGAVRLTLRGRLLASELFWRLLPDALAETG